MGETSPNELRTDDLRRIRVVGCSCSGKTTLARGLADILGCRHVELDAIHWLSDWRERPRDQTRARIAEVVKEDRWVIDGNYRELDDLTWPRATALLWLNYSFPLTLGRALRRTLRRAWTREVIFSGNRETFRRALLSRDSILLWVVTSFGRRRRALRPVFDAPAPRGRRHVELRRPGDTDALLRHVALLQVPAGAAT